MKNRKFDVILFNTPYLPTEEDEVIDSNLNYAFDGGLNEGYFISTSKENAADLIQTIQSGTKCRDGDIVYYHLEDNHN